MNCKNENSLTVSLNITDQTEVSSLQAYVFSSGGKNIGSAPISVNEAAVISMPDNMDGRAIEVFLGPVAKENEPVPTVNMLKRAGAYAMPARYLIDRPEFDFTIPGIILPLWCTCNVNGRVIKRVTLGDGSVDEMPVCNARVHICEVDSWDLILPRIPDLDIFKLRDDLLDKLYPVRPPFPDPGPFIPDVPMPEPPIFESPLPAFNALSSDFKKTTFNQNANVFLTKKLVSLPQQLAITNPAINALANTSNVNEIRSQLLQLNYFLYPFWCFFPYIWRHYHKDCIRTVDVDSRGRFSTTISHDCNDQPDLYFWVEQLQDGVWTTVYKPGVACNTKWNYECGTEVLINAPDAEACEEPGYDIPDGVTLFVLPYKIGHKHIWGTPLGAPPAPNGWLRSDGFVNYYTSNLGMLNDAPFGGTLHFHHDDSYFIPKGDSVPGDEDNSIKYYRYSYRRVEDAGDWTAMTIPQFRGYIVEYNNGDSPTYESYPVPPQTVGTEPNLFEFRPRTPPVPGGVDATTVKLMSWSIGNLNNVAASWNTRATAPAMSVSNITDDAGTFEVKIEVFNEAGQLVMPGASTFEFLALNSDRRTTRLADSGEISNGAFVFKVHIDNNNVTAILPQPSIDGIRASDDCGFLRYDDAGELVKVEFTATHPNDHAVFDFNITRGSNVLATASTAGIYTETAATSAPPYNDVGGIYQHDFAAVDLVGTCINAAFAANLHIWGKATDGHDRLGIGGERLIAFALAESEDEEV